MKTMISLAVFAGWMALAPLMAQENQGPPRTAARRAGNPPPSTANDTGDYASDIVVVRDAQNQALDQAREMLEKAENLRDRPALETAIKEMERAQAALDDARKSPEKLPAALAAEQAAYQALLKVTPREYRMSRSQRGGQQGGNAGQAGRRQLDELDMQKEENRYETERQASTPQNAQQREKTQTADRLKELSQRQQDLNSRLRELQTALQAARTDQEREEIRRQLKRLQDEQRQMLAKVDELRQKLDQSPNAGSQADAQKQLEQTRSDMERAAQEMERQSASGALAAGARAEERMKNLRDDLRKQTSSQFSGQMRQLLNQARELKRQQEEIADGLDSLNNAEQKTLDSSSARRQIVQQMKQQRSSLTNLLSEMRSVTEQAEATEPLLSKELYDTLRRADQMRTENLLDVGSQLTDRGFLPQAAQVERAARTNITELARSVERAAQSVLGSEADALRFAQKELDDLTRQLKQEVAGEGTNGPALAAGDLQEGPGRTNRLARAGEQSSSGNLDTNSTNQPRGRSPGRNSQTVSNNPQGQQRGEGNAPGETQNGNRGHQADEKNAEQASAGNPQDGREQAANGSAPGAGNRSASDQQQPNAISPNSQNRSSGARQGDRLRQFVEQLGARGGDGGPITGNDYLNWTDRLRDVESVVDPADLRNQLATVRERASVMREDFRQRGRKPDADVVRVQLLAPLTQVRVWLQEELARKNNADSLVPLDRDPVPDSFSELVRKYYEKLGSAQ